MKLLSGNKFRDAVMLMTLMICNMVGLWFVAIGYTTYTLMIAGIPYFFSTTGLGMVCAMSVSRQEAINECVTILEKERNSDEN